MKCLLLSLTPGAAAVVDFIRDFERRSDSGVRLENAIRSLVCSEAPGLSYAGLTFILIFA